ncbi:sugar phosphate nucleotidyltransferase [Natronospora cellulosivora (SeqCode)]
MKAVIMAGGQGSRLRPLTCDLPKPMVPIVNYPVMEYIIELLKEQGIKDIAVTSFYLPETIEDYFGNGEKWGVNLHYFIEEEPLGTAGSVHNADEFLDETFIVISGDAITDFNLKEAIDFHNNENADATLVLAKEDIPLEYGVVMTDDDGKIVRFLEKPNWGQVFSDTINTGIYILEPAIFDLFEKYKKYDFSQDLFPLMLSKGMNLYGVALDGYWNDIGSLEEYHNTQFALLKGDIDLPLKAPCSLGDNYWMEDGVELDESVEVEDSVYIGEGSKIGKGVYLENCIIGRNCRISANTSIKNAILWDNTLIEENAEIRGAILANNITVKQGAAIFDMTAVGRDVIIGRNSRLKPGIKIWPEKEIDDRTVVDTSIVWPVHWSRNIFSNKGIVGDSNIDITPEFISNLAVAYGSTLARDNEVIVSCDAYNISTALKRAMISGLQASGIDVVDVGETISSIARYCVLDLQAQGGVHIRVSSQDPNRTVVEFYNKHGVNISVNEQKGIEKKFFTRDYNRVFINEIGDFAYAPEMNKKYLDHLVDNVRSKEIKSNYFSVVVDYEHDSLGDVLPLFLRRLNCQLLSTRNYSDEGLPISMRRRLEARQRVARIMRDNKSDLGIIIDHNGEEIHLINRQGEAISKLKYQVLISFILLERGIKYIPLPVNTPAVIESLAEEYNAEVEYTPINPQVAMEKYYQNNRDENTEILRFYPYTDALAGLALIMEQMAIDNVSLEQLINRLPEFFLNNAEIKCDWKNKGRVMRHLSKETDENTEMIDGIKFRHNNGWALVVPDSERPVFHIYAEGQDTETAESLTGFYLDKVKEIIGE